MVQKYDYWERRSLKRFTVSEKVGRECVSKTVAIYDEALLNIDKNIQSVYKNYMDELGLDHNMKVLLSKADTLAFFKKLESLGMDDYVKKNYISRITRLEKLKGEINAELYKVKRKETFETGKAYKIIVDNSFNRSVKDFSVQLGKKANKTINMHLDNKQINMIVNSKWSDKHYSERIYRNVDNLAKKINVTITSGIASGESVYKTSRKIRKAFGVSKYQSERLVKTETNYFHNHGEALAYKNLGIKKYEYMAHVDDKTSDICQGLNMKIFNVKDIKIGVNYPPMHVNCRSTTGISIDD